MDSISAAGTLNLISVSAT